jgi:hypothetical protein
MSSESPGVLVGLSNVLTGRRERVPRGGEPDAAVRDRLRTRARRALEGREAYIHDAVLLGRRVRLFSNSHHLADFWRDNFPVETEWRAATGLDVPREPALTAYAVVGVPGEPEQSCLAGPEVFLFNTSYYLDLRAGVLEALARTLPIEESLVHGGAVELGGKGLVWTYPKEVVHPTPTWGLMELPGSRLVADGWFLREASGHIRALERRLYARTSLVDAYPALLPRLLRCKFENVPDPTAAQADALAPRAAEILREAEAADPRGALRAWPREKALDFAVRMIADPAARVLLDPAELFGRTRVSASTRAAAAFDLRAGDGVPVAPAAAGTFPCPAWTVHVGAVGGHPRELARLMSRKT